MQKNDQYLIFSEIVREKAYTILSSKFECIYNHVTEYCDELYTRKDKTSINLGVEELTYFVLYALKQVYDINCISHISGVHLHWIKDKVSMKILDTFEPSQLDFEETFDTAGLYTSATIYVFMNLMSVSNDVFWHHSWRHFYSIRNLKNDLLEIPLNLRCPRDLKPAVDLITFDSFPYDLGFLKEIEQYIAEDAFYSKMKDRQKSKANISWSTIIECIKNSDKEHADFLSTFLTSLLNKDIQNDKLYTQCSKSLCAKINEIKQYTPPVTSITVAGNNNGIIAEKLLAPNDPEEL